MPFRPIRVLLLALLMGADLLGGLRCGLRVSIVKRTYLGTQVSWLRVYKDAELLITRFHVAIVCNGL